MKKIIIFVLIVALGAGIFFGVRFLFFNSPNTERPFNIVNDLTTSEEYTKLESLLRSEYPNNAYNKINSFTSYYYARQTNFNTTTENQTVYYELKYTHERLLKINSLYRDYLTFIEYYQSNILYLDATSELGGLISKLDKQKRTLQNKIEEITSYYDSSLKVYLDELTTTAFTGSNTTQVVNIVKYANDVYLRKYTTLNIEFIYEAFEFCSIAQEIIVSSARTLEANGYKAAIYKVATNLARDNISYLKSAPAQYSHNNELPNENPIKWTTEKESAFTLYLTIKSKMVSLPRNDLVIINYENEYTVKYSYSGNVIAQLTSSYKIETTSIENRNISKFTANILEIKKEIEERGSIEAVSDSPDLYISPYLQSISDMNEVIEIKKLFVYLFGTVA